MEYFKINYYRLQHLYQIKFFKLIIVVISIIISLIILSCFMKITRKISFYGVYNDDILKIKINNKLSDILKNNQYIVFNGTKTSYKIFAYGKYEIIDNEIYQEMDLIVEKEFFNNEVGLIELHYDKQKIIEYIFELFK